MKKLLRSVVRIIDRSPIRQRLLVAAVQLRLKDSPSGALCSESCLCGKVAWRMGPTYLTKWGKVVLVICKNCSMVRSGSVLSAAQLSGLYFQDTIYKPPPWWQWENERQRFYHVVGDLEKRNYLTGRVLDIGCNAGYALDVFQERGWEVTGIEPNQSTAKFARERLGATIYSDISLIPKGETFDVILLSHVLEHIREPNEFLRGAATHLKPQGVFYIQVPNYGSKTVRYVLKGTWSGFLPAQHVWYFNFKTLAAFMSRHGFRVVACYTRERLKFRSSNLIKGVLKAPAVLAQMILPHDGFELVGIFGRDWGNG